MPLCNLDDLAVFMHVVNRHSFSAAARDLRRKHAEIGTSDSGGVSTKQSTK